MSRNGKSPQRRLLALEMAKARQRVLAWRKGRENVFTACLLDVLET